VNAGADFELRPKLDAFERAMLQTVPGMTEEGAKKASAEWEKNFHKQQALKLSGLSDIHKKTGGDIGKTWSDLGKKITTTAGGPVAALGDAIFELVPKAAQASSAMGGVAVAGGAVAAVAVGVVAVGAAVLALADHAAEAEARLEKAGLAAMIPEDSRASIQEYNEATTSLRNSVDLLTVSVGADAAQGVAELATAVSGVVALLTQFRDGADEVRDAIATALPFIEDMEWWVSRAGMAMITLGLSIPAEVLYDHATAAGVAAAADQEAAASALDAAEAYALLGLSVTDDEVKAGEARAKAREVEEARKLAAWQKASEEKQRLQRAEYAAMLEAQNQFEAEKQARAAEWAEMQANTERANTAWVVALANEEADARVAAELRWAEETRKARDEQMAQFQADTDLQIQFATETANNSLDLISTVLDGRIQALSQGNKQERQAARQLAIFQREIATFGIAASTAQAVIKAFALFGPPPSPVGIAAAAAAVTAGGVQAAAVLSQPLPSAFTGLDRVRTGAGGEALHVLHQNEAVVPSDVTAALGPSATRDLVEGRGVQGGGGGGDVVLDGEVVGRVLARKIAAGGALSRAVHGSEPVGYRQPYGG
jgi:hypothetical protein